MDSRWRIELLGGLRATRHDRLVTRFQTHKTGALLAYLAYLCRGPHPREALIEQLWPESEPRAGRNKLSLALSSLRHQFEPPSISAGTVILASRAAVQLNPDAISTDLARFEAALQAAARVGSSVEQTHRLSEAVGLYSGELLPGYFEDWIVPERQRLAELYLQALDELILQLEHAGNLPGAVHYARRAVCSDPSRRRPTICSSGCWPPLASPKRRCASMRNSNGSWARSWRPSRLRKPGPSPTRSETSARGRRPPLFPLSPCRRFLLPRALSL